MASDGYPYGGSDFEPDAEAVLASRVYGILNARLATFSIQFDF